MRELLLVAGVLVIFTLGARVMDALDRGLREQKAPYDTRTRARHKRPWKRERKCGMIAPRTKDEPKRGGEDRGYEKGDPAP